MADFVKRGDIDFVAQLQTFRSVLPTYTMALGLTAADMAEVDSHSEGIAYIVLRNNGAAGFVQDWSKLKDQVRYGTGGAVLQPFPAPPEVTTPPLIIPINVEAGFRALVKRIKAAKGYTTGIGENLGIEAPASTIDPHTLKAVIKIVAGEGAHPFIKWKKGPTGGIHIWVDRSGGNNFQFLATDTQPDYLDTYTLPGPGQSQVWNYKAIHFTGDTQATEWSDPVSFTVKGV